MKAVTVDFEYDNTGNATNKGLVPQVRGLLLAANLGSLTGASPTVYSCFMPRGFHRYHESNRRSESKDLAGFTLPFTSYSARCRSPSLLRREGSWP